VNAADDPDLIAAATRILRWRELGPAGMAVELFGIPPEWDPVKKEGVTPWQWKASKILVEKKRLSIRSGHGVGKSAFMAWCIIWVLLCFFPVRAPATAPTGHQLKDILWAEIAKWLGRMAENVPEIAAQFEWLTDEFRLRDAPKESFATARTARAERPEALQGAHAHGPEAAVLVLVDEAPGVPDVIFEVGEGVLTAENAYAVMAGNPSRVSGYFYDSHHKNRHLWGVLHVPCSASPTVSPNYAKEMEAKYGRDSNIYRIRVLGEFPKADPDQLIPLYLCEEAQARYEKIEHTGPIVWGVDPAGQGTDRTVLIKRNDVTTLAKHQTWRGLEAMQVAGKIYNEWLDCKPEDRPTSVCVDGIGIGAGIASRLAELGLPVLSVMVSELPANRREYWRLRDELYWKVRDWLVSRKAALHPDDDELVAELTLFRWLPPTSDGLIRIERKDEVKRRLKTESSPDVADALMLSFAFMPPWHGTSAPKAQAPVSFADAAE
jgi:hypothetical protein